MAAWVERTTEVKGDQGEGASPAAGSNEGGSSCRRREWRCERCRMGDRNLSTRSVLRASRREGQPRGPRGSSTTDERDDARPRVVERLREDEDGAGDGDSEVAPGWDCEGGEHQLVRQSERESRGESTH